MKDVELKSKEFLQTFLNEPEEKIEAIKKDEYRDLPVAMLPLGKLYHPNVRLEGRALNVGEISNYSTLESDDVNLVRPKLDEILQKSLKLSNRNMKMSYKNVFVNDRLYLIYTIRELTFQNGRVLTLPVKCTNDACKHDFDIELLRQNMEMWPMTEEIWSYFNPQFGCFVFPTSIQDEPYYLRPPTIGLQESFYHWMTEQRYKKKDINPSFVKIMPYMANAVELSIDELSELQEEYLKGLEKPHAADEFQFLSDTVDQFKNNSFHLGLKGMVKRCPKCGTEVRTNTVFPKKARDLFIVPNAFRHYIKK